MRAVLLKLLGVAHFKLFDLLLVFFLSSAEDFVPVLVKFLVLLNVRRLDVFLALLMRKHELLILHVKLLFFQLQDSVLCHFGL